MISVVWKRSGVRQGQWKKREWRRDIEYTANSVATWFNHRCETDVCSTRNRRILFWMYGGSHRKCRQSRCEVYNIRPVQVALEGQGCTSISQVHPSSFCAYLNPSECILIPGQTISAPINVGRSRSGYDGGYYRRDAIGNNQDKDD